MMFFGFLVGCGSRREEYELPSVFYAQNQDELLQIISEDLYRSDEVYVGIAMQQISEFVSNLLSMADSSREIYLEDFDFLLSVVGNDLSDNTDAYWELVRERIEGFFHVNDFIFHYLLLSVIDVGDIFLYPYHVLHYDDFSFTNYIVSPNRTLVIVYQ